MNVLAMTIEEEEDEAPRLYSKPVVFAVDEVLPQHATIHADLERWGAWLREKYTPSTCASMEKDFYKGGADATPPATAPKPADPRLVHIDQAWRLMVRRVPDHARCLHLFYIEREEPKLIARRLAIEKRAFPRFMAYCRAMVLNILRELDVS